MNRAYRKKNTVRQSGLMKQVLIASVSLSIGYLCSTFVDVNILSSWLKKLLTAQDNTVVTSQKSADVQKPKLEFYTLLTKDDPHGVQLATAEEKQSVSENTQTSSQNAEALSRNMQVSPSPVSQAQIAAVQAENKEHSVTAAEQNAVVTAQTMANNQRLFAPIKPAVATTALKTNEISKTTKPQEGEFVLQIAAFKSNVEAEKMRANLLMKGFDVSIVQAKYANGAWYRVVVGPFLSRMDAQRVQTSLAQKERIVGMIRKRDV